MKEIITTSDIQILEIALICYHVEGSKSVMSDEEFYRLSEILEEMHSLCTEKNGYSLEMVVKERSAYVN